MVRYKVQTCNLEASLWGARWWRGLEMLGQVAAGGAVTGQEQEL